MMNKTTDFAKYISTFISRYLPIERGFSKNTIKAYSQTFLLLIDYIEKEKKIKLNNLTLKKISKEIIVDFLDYIQLQRACSNSTRNARLAAIHSFYNYLKYEDLFHLIECQRILSIKFKKSQAKPMKYLSIEGIKLLLKQPNISTIKGRRDLTLLALTYDTGARVQEILDLTPSRIQLDSPATVRILGKGNKERLIPMLASQVAILKKYLQENGLNELSANMYPLFHNSRKEKLTRAGVNFIISKYAKMARQENQLLIPDRISCHSLRHSKAMHLLQAGSRLIDIRDILGHVSVLTTEIYAKIDLKQKRESLENAYRNVIPEETAKWKNDIELSDWLRKFT